MLSPTACQRPERVLAVAKEAQLGEEVQADDEDSEPARPPLTAHQPEAGEHKQCPQISMTQPQAVRSTSRKPERVTA